MRSTPVNKNVFIGLGSNLGNREEHLQKALDTLAEFFEIKAKSSIYETAPIGYQNQPDFLNMVIKGTTALSPQELLLKLQEVEQKLGRQRSFKNAPRNIDLDILLFDNRMVAQNDLQIPHPELINRQFVLIPLLEIAPELKKSVGTGKTDNQSVKKWTRKKSKN
jgi:2-amino-4-hydroxy-6-hydroxymethyldihydropteridine diphosphokinase